jgi:adenylate cyclase
LFSLAYRFLTADKMQTLFHNAVAVFVGKRVATSLQESQTISLTGSRQFVTILFSDIRGFTAWCESKDPAQVVESLNQYLGQMVSIIVSHRGHVNKFIGDGILAVFSDLDGTTPGDHVVRALRCGTEMVTAPGPFKTGVGIHSGPVVIGNVGSEDKMEYTVLGDTVNVASRLESLNKEQKTKLLISEATHALVNGQVETAHLASVMIRGQTKPMNLYTEASLARLREAGTNGGGT